MLRTRRRLLEFPQAHLDRLLHRYALLILDGDYYRLRDHRDEPEAVRHPWCRGQPGPDAQRDSKRPDAPEVLRPCDELI